MLLHIRFMNNEEERLSITCCTRTKQFSFYINTYRLRRFVIDVLKQLVKDALLCVLEFVIQNLIL